jgi:WD40 repeat protein
MKTAKLVVTIWIKGVLAIFGVLIVGFLLWSVWAGWIQPRLAASTTCLRESGCLYTVVNGSSSVRVVGFSADGSRLLTRGGETLLHDTETGERAGRLRPALPNLLTTTPTIHFMGERPEIAILSREGIEFFDHEGTLMRTWRALPGENTRYFAPLPLVNGFALAQEEAVALYNFPEGRVFTRLPDTPGISLLAASADGGILAGYHAQSDTLYVWPLQSLRDTIAIPAGGAPRTLQLSGDGRLLAASTDELAQVWRVADGERLLWVDPPEQSRINYLSLSANGERLALGYNNRLVEVWSVADADLRQQLAHPRPISGVALSPDGERLAVGLSRDARFIRYTEQQLNAFQSRGTSAYRYLSPNTTYTERLPGFAIVRDVGE